LKTGKIEGGYLEATTTMMLKIQSGWLKGLTLKLPETPGTRPTSHKVREAVTNMVQEILPGAVCLDLFAGSGAMGFELASRGAGKVVFVESAPAMVRGIKKAIVQCQSRAGAGDGSKSSFHLIGRSLESAWEELRSFGPFDIVWADPPYAELTRWLGGSQPKLCQVVKQDGFLMIESETKTAKTVRELLQSGWEPVKERQYGSTTVLVFARKAASGEDGDKGE
jgi:16S rRNA (guanine966-N2)-methyltransferase